MNVLQISTMYFTYVFIVRRLDFYGLKDNGRATYIYFLFVTHMPYYRLLIRTTQGLKSFLTMRKPNEVVLMTN